MWLNSANERGLFISALTLGELHRGVRSKRRSDPAGAAHLGQWANDLQGRFAGRILPIDAAVAALWGELSAERNRPVINMLLAATALVNDLVLVTRDISDLRGIALRLVDPWTGTAMP